MSDNKKVVYSDGTYDFVGKYSVRVLHEYGTVLYLLNDILTICGIKYPGKWLNAQKSRHDKEYKSSKKTVLVYPEGNGSNQKRKSRFVTAEQARIIIRDTTAKKDDVRWLENLFASETISASDTITDYKETEIKNILSESNSAYINKTFKPDDVIDRILFDLIELKKYTKSLNI